MMKLLKISGIFLAIFMLSACEDWIDRKPTDGLISNEYWKKKQDVEATLMGAYSTFRKMEDRLFLYGELRGDMIITNSGSGVRNYERNIEEGNIYSDNPLCDWSRFYEVINYCNHVIKYSSQVLDEDETFNSYESRSLVSEALFLRGLAYFYLVRIFKDVPLVLDPTDSDGGEFFPKKERAKVIIQHIEDDLLKALKTARSYYGAEEQNKGRATPAAINALLADVSLWKAAMAENSVKADSAYKACLSYIKNIENDEQNTYILLPPSQWFDNFYPGNTVEGIFEFQIDQTQGQGNRMYYLTWMMNYYSPTEYTLEILLPKDSRELVRGPGSISIEYKGSGYKIFKYYGTAPDGRSRRSGSEQSSCNWMVYRYADVMLMKAEALTQKSNPEYVKAEAILNDLRIRADMKSVNPGYSREKFEDAILEERAKELAFEGKRWFDLLRMGIRNNYARKSKLIEKIIEKVPSTQRLVLASKLTDPNAWYLPIYEPELEQNDNLEQNPFYADETVEE